MYFINQIGEKLSVLVVIDHSKETLKIGATFLGPEPIRQALGLDHN